MPPCESCRGQQVANLGLTGQHTNGLHPNSRSLGFRPMSTLSATVCLNCGRTTFYADDLAKIREAAQRHPDWFTW
ncbi:hypothetical protein GCM10022220_55340 [Actinocatenispora rupis]|uniref:Uncharacterized protein n=1 Tax=Actinocatenispora rupis TaxID=519421 RepID=A0A8J3JEQ7_9ACTN|nr:hypothetical protein Aru02nite_54670 [Actinocatenispora rupis]